MCYTVIAMASCSYCVCTTLQVAGYACQLDVSPEGRFVVGRDISCIEGYVH